MLSRWCRDSGPVLLGFQTEPVLDSPPSDLQHQPMRLRSASRKQPSLTPCHPVSSMGWLTGDRDWATTYKRGQKRVLGKDGEVKTSGLSLPFPTLLPPPCLGISHCTGVPTLPERLELPQAQPELMAPSPRGLDSTPPPSCPTLPCSSFPSR